ncbi:DUF6365 family protein [Bradyrhizobium sp. AUGA SZCCT0283]|uniref:DUF6365 family protein n=1 Tax=Bradyrhizobium sp. AUGA SZCCT0283 TaxID=2807671 RepID=UPI001BA64EDE|nr:DUF6365 family protein [Bradyrhizobium sp. AUGA SZCCT0283]MBR1274273.1 hypothetical protein [Bradyrhizobium sp. AUGA SZCCT0283]
MQRILIVTPHTLSCGEAITAIHVANHLARHGWQANFLASPNTAKLIPPKFETRLLAGDLKENQVVWVQTVRRLKPKLVLFADYPLLALQAGSVPLANEAWIESLELLDAALLTLDHLDLAHADRLPSLPPPNRMGILLPCPIHNPSRQAGPKLALFRYWTPPATLDSDRRSALRARYLGCSRGLLVFHAVPRWTQFMATIMNQPLYNFLPKLLIRYLAGMPDPITVVSVNDGTLLPSLTVNDLTIVNLPNMPPNEFEETLACSDLMLSENCFSVSLGKAVCSLVPAVLWRHTLNPIDVLTSEDDLVSSVAAEMILHNPKSLNPWLAFPSFDPSLVSAFNSLKDEPAIQCLEIFGGTSTHRAIRALLTDEREREMFRARQLAYRERVSELPTPLEAIQKLTGC